MLVETDDGISSLRLNLGIIVGDLIRLNTRDCIVWSCAQFKKAALFLLASTGQPWRNFLRFRGITCDSFGLHDVKVWCLADHAVKSKEVDMLG